MAASSSRMTRTSADCRATCSMATRSSAPWPPRLSCISPAARARSASRNSISPNSALTVSAAVSTSCSSASSPASMAARKAVPPASISRSTMAMSDRTSSAYPSPADRISRRLRLISRCRSLRDGLAEGCADRTRSTAAATASARALAPTEGRTLILATAAAPSSPAASARAGPSAAAHSNGSTAGAGRPRSSWRPCRAARSSHSRIPAWSRRTSSKSPKPSTPNRP